MNTNLSLAIKLTLYTLKNPKMYKYNFLEEQFTIGMMLLSVQQMFSIPDLWSYGFRMAVQIGLRVNGTSFFHFPVVLLYVHKCQGLRRPL